MAEHNVQININFVPSTNVVSNNSSLVTNAGSPSLPTPTGSYTVTTNIPVMPPAEQHARSISTQQHVGRDFPLDEHYRCMEAIDRLDQRTLASMMKSMMTKYPDVSRTIQAEYPNRLAAQERRARATAQKPKIPDFESIDRAAWRLLNTSVLRGSRHFEFEASFAVSTQIATLVELVVEKANKSALYRTKKLAMWTLRNIGKSVMLSTGVLGRQVRKRFSYNDILTKAIRSIAKCMTPEERLRLGQSHTLDGDTFDDRLWDLVLDADKLHTFKRLGEVTWMFDEKTYHMDWDTSSSDDLDEQSEDDAESDVDSFSQSEDITSGNGSRNPHPDNKTSGDESKEAQPEDAGDHDEDQSRPRKRRRPSRLIEEI